MIDGGFRGRSLNASNSIGNCRGGRGDAHGMATSSTPTTEKVTELSVREITDICLVHVILTERRMLKLVLNVKYLLLLSFLTEAEF